ncbi:MAG TPA: periplasmic heavy metal sensor [Phycisphaerae bacterium]|nr:periplasmic heavy metal sensor [Phycisphaerae bacterium]
MKKLLLAAMVGLPLATGLGAAAVHGAAPGHVGPLRAFLLNLSDRRQALRTDLALTADQQHKLREIVMSHRSEIVAAATPIVDKGRALRAAIAASPEDDAAIRLAGEDLGKAIGDAGVLAAKIRTEARAVLTPDQDQKLDDFRKATDDQIDTLLKELGTP